MDDNLFILCEFDLNCIDANEGTDRVVRLDPTAFYVYIPN